MQKLYRSVTDKKIAGVCGGIGKFFNVDSTFIRLIWAIFCIMGGSGVIAYFICAAIIPAEPVGSGGSDYDKEGPQGYGSEGFRQNQSQSKEEDVVDARVNNDPPNAN